MEADSDDSDEDQEASLTPSDAESDEDSDSDDSDDSASSGDEDDGKGPRARSSKHAPAEQSSRYQVSRRREVVAVPKRTTRDPRFDRAAGTTQRDHAFRAYGFLSQYADSEMAELRSAIKDPKLAGEQRDTLRRKLNSMQNRKRADADKELRRKVVQEHRATERQAVAEGKKPFHLKTSALKRLALEKKFESMKPKDRDKAIDRRRKKDAQKEKKNMPASRRIAG
ncbi:hypothetical protein ANO11243_016440 [Dothideomycetidae sp. 11243]|nr:hypothetical protein ANO11243_016440 [fungal sp. No.11243]